MSNTTELQSKIIQELKDNPESDNQKVADRLDCSASYVSTIRNRYEFEIFGEIDLTDYECTISYSNPYSVIAIGELRNKFDRIDEDVVKLEFEDEEHGKYDIFAPITNSFDIQAESHSITYGIYESFSHIDVENLTRFDQYNIPEEEGPGIYSPDSFRRFYSDCLEFLQDQQSGADLIIGHGLLTARSDGSDETGSIFPLLKSLESKQVFVDLLKGNVPKVNKVTGYSDISTPDTVYFGSHSNLDKRTREQLRDDLLEKKYFDTGFTQIHYNNVFCHGPLVESPEKRVIEINEQNLEIIHPRMEQIQLSSDDIGFDELTDVFDSLSLMVESEDGTQTTETIEMQVDSEKRIVFEIPPAPIHLYFESDEITWIYYNEISHINEFVESASDIISDEFDIDIEIEASYNLSSSSPLSFECWVFDTNALYHQIVDDEPSNVLRTIMPNRELHSSKIEVPWATLYEINKHKDRGNAPPRAQEQGLENLRTIELLDDLGFIEANIQELPEEIHTNIGESDIADMYVLQFAQKNNAALISGDQRLREIGTASGVDVVDIHDLAVVDPTPELDDTIRDRILPKVGDQLSKKAGIIENLEEEIDRAYNRSTYQISGENNASAKNYLRRWVSEREIVPYIKNDEIWFANAVEKEAVITSAAIGLISNTIDECNGEKYLSEDILQELGRSFNLSEPGYPFISFQAPISELLSQQSSSLEGFSMYARRLYKLSDAENIHYNSTTLDNADLQMDPTHDAVLLAKERSCALICTDEEDYVYRIAGLLDVPVKMISD